MGAFAHMAIGAMANRQFDPRYDYSCRCGWIDWAHADLRQHRPLIDQLRAEASRVPFDNKQNYFLDGDRAFVIYYGFSSGMGHMLERHWVIKKGLSDSEKASVALAIFESAGRDLEGWQGSIALREFSGSSYSVEDMTSNKLGFYMALRGLNKETIARKCGVISRDKAYDVYVEANKRGGLGAIKNKASYPVYFDCEECKDSPQSMPSDFDSIRPAAHGRLFVMPYIGYIGPRITGDRLNDAHFFSTGMHKMLPKKNR